MIERLKDYNMILRVLLLILIVCSSPTYAMLSDGIHQSKDYVKFVESQKAFNSSCFIYDTHRHILQTGVLIAPDIVMTAAHGFEGSLHLKSIIVGFGETVGLDSKHNYGVVSFRTHPRYFHTDYPAKEKYDMLFFKLDKPVKGIEPVPLFEEEILEEIPPLYVATFGSADIPYGDQVRRRAFALPESEIFSLMGRDPEGLYENKTVMMGSIFFEPLNEIKPVKQHGPEKELRTYYANMKWREMNKPPYALALAGSSGAPVFINLQKNGVMKTYVFGIIQSFSHLSSSSFHHYDNDRETQRLLKIDRKKVYGRYQSVFCIPYKLFQPLQAYKHHPKTYRLSRHVKAILDEFEGVKVPERKHSVHKKLSSHHHGQAKGTLSHNLLNP